MREMVTIQNGDLTADVLETSLPVWRASGWTVVDDGGSEVEEADEPTDTETEVEEEVPEEEPELDTDDEE